MASEGPDPRAFTDWEEAFQHPIPTVRKFEQRLRGHAEQNRQKLRTIVGGSYRDLLGTADRIIEMDRQMRLVERELGLAGQRCNSRAVERIFANSARFNTELLTEKKPRFSLAAQIAMLQSCASVIARLLKGRKSPLLAAKIVVLSRLTHKVLSAQQPNSELIESLRNRLSSLRLRLLTLIEQRLSDPEADWKVLVDHMCAYSLTTSATPTDILRYFQKVRLNAMENCLGSEDNGSEDAVKAVKLLVKTLQVCQTIFPKRLSDALARLKDIPLLQQKDVAALTELQLDIHGYWIAEELQNYTPWPRHDQLQKPEADKELKKWAQRASQSFKQGLKSNLALKDSFDDVLHIRRFVFDSWPRSSKSLPGLDSEEVVDELREILNERLVSILHQSAIRLKEVLAVLEEGLTAVENQPSNGFALWDSSLVNADASNGAASFKRKIQHSFHGLDSTSSRVIESYDTWIENVTSLMSGIKTMKSDRWVTDVGDDDDDIETDSRQALLSEDDPRELEDILAKNLKDALDKFQSGLKETFADITGDASSGSVKQYAVCLRVTRGITQRTVGQGFGRKLQVVPEINLEMIQPVQLQLSQLAIDAPLEEYEQRLLRASRSPTLNSKLLWEGTPPLPIQPSSTVYRFLRSVNSSMAGIGCDAWSAGTVRGVKRIALEKSLGIIERVDEKDFNTVEHDLKLNGKDKPESPKKDIEAGAEDGNESQSLGPAEQSPDTNTGNDNNMEKVIQSIFDAFYLNKALGIPEQELDAGSLKLLFKRSNLEEPELSRLDKSAGDYWKRTYLMFALLSE